MTRQRQPNPVLRWLAFVLVIIMLLVTLSPDSTAATGNPQIGTWVCNAVEMYCAALDIIGWLPDWMLRFPDVNFQWNPTLPWIGADDDTISNVNVWTWFYFRPVPSTQNFVGFLPPVLHFETWSPYPVDVWCFGDDTTALWEIHLPWPKRYEYSSYGQSHQASNGDPAFQAYAVTAWRVDVYYIVFGPCDWGVCYIGEFTIPVLPICQDKNVPVKQVQSHLIPSLEDILP